MRARQHYFMTGTSVVNSAPAGSWWPLPLLAGLLPAVAAIAALSLSISLGLVPACNPFWEGCVSVSRAGRYDLPNHVFRALMLPAAALQALTWWLCARWLMTLGAQPGRAARMIPWPGAVAAACLALYVLTLGADTDSYRTLRRNGAVLYFGLTYLCMLAAAGALRGLARAGALAGPARLERFLLALCVLVLCMGLVQAFAVPLLEDSASRRRVENVLEWNTGLAFTFFFITLAWLWRSARARPQAVRCDPSEKSPATD
jgi:hypothetical protein